MKRYSVIPFILICVLNISACSQSYNDVNKITLTVDPNQKENKYKLICITDKDSIQSFMEKLYHRKSEPVKFYPRYSIEISYSNRTEKYFGNANHIKDMDGYTYRLLAKEWEIFNY